MKKRPSIIATCLAIVASFVCAWPLIWLALSVFKTNREIFKPLQVFPKEWKLDGIRGLFDGSYFSFWQAFANSLITAGAQTILAIAVTSMAGYTFAWNPPKRRLFWFTLAVSVIVLPRQVLAVPMFEWLVQLHLIDSLAGIWLPGAVSGIGILYFTQVFRRLPVNLIETARLAGAKEWQIYKLLVPLTLPAMIAFGVIQFVLAWHEHLMPLLVLASESKRTLPLALASLYGSSLRIPQSVILAGAVAGIAPVMLLFAASWRLLGSAASDLTAEE